MNKQEFEAYLDAFNQPDFERLADFFTEDAVFAHLPHLPKLIGRNAILDFYRDVKSKLHETVKPLNLFVDDHGIAAEVSTEFVPFADYPDFPSTPLAPGDVYRMTGIVFYSAAGRKFSYIRGVARLTASVTRADGVTTIIAGPDTN
jgi:hypothetical protein